MEQSINVNFQNLTKEERETLLQLCKKSQKKEIKKGLWIPKEDERYYYINDYGTINNNSFSVNSPYDKWRIDSDNYFKAKKEAEFEIEKRKVLSELRKFATKNNTEEIDWNDSSQEKYYIYYDYKNKYLDITVVWSLRRLNDIYFTSRNICHKAIEEVGEDRIKKYLFNAEE